MVLPPPAPAPTSLSPSFPTLTPTPTPTPTLTPLPPPTPTPTPAPASTPRSRPRSRIRPRRITRITRITTHTLAPTHTPPPPLLHSSRSRRRHLGQILQPLPHPLRQNAHTNRREEIDTKPRVLRVVCREYPRQSRLQRIIPQLRRQRLNPYARSEILNQNFDEDSAARGSVCFVEFDIMKNTPINTIRSE